MPDTLSRPLSSAKAASARKRALNEIEKAIAAAEEAEQHLRRLRAAETKVKAARDALIRQAALLGASKTEISTRLGITRQHLYEAINRPDEQDDRWIDELVDRHVEAESRWAKNGQKGEIGDYWPL